MIELNNENSISKIDSLYNEYNNKGTAISVDFSQLVPDVKRTERYTHYIHPYPAKLLPSIPYFFLNTEKFCPRNGVVLDPFCGSGTVLLEAILSGRNALGADSNPIARLISEAKTKYIDADTLHLSLNCILKKAYKDKLDRLFDFPNRDYWFTHNAQIQLARLLYAIKAIKNHSIKVFYLTCFSNIVKKASYADPRIYVPVKIKPERFHDRPALFNQLIKKSESLKDINVYDLFKAVSLENIQRVGTLESVSCENTVNLVSSDARFLSKKIGGKERLEDESVDLVLTSPPYAGAQKYIRSSRLSLNWLGMGDSSCIKNLESKNIGRECFDKNELLINKTGVIDADYLIDKIKTIDKTRACIVSTYLNEMRKAIKESYRVLKKGGFMILVVGSNKVCGYDFNTPLFLNKIAEEFGMQTELQLVDSIKKYGMITIRNTTASIIESEYIIVLKK